MEGLEAKALRRLHKLQSWGSSAWKRADVVGHFVSPSKDPWVGLTPLRGEGTWVSVFPPDPW